MEKQILFLKNILDDCVLIDAMSSLNVNKGA